MKKYVFSVMLASLSAVAGAQEPAWSYELPETGLMPSAFSLDFVSSMRERHGGASHFGLQNVNLTIPLSDPRRSSVRGWSLNAELSSTITFVDAEGTLNLQSDTLHKFTLPVSFIRDTAGGHRIILAAAPTVASDMESFSRCFDLGLYGSYTRKVNESFSFTLGLAAYPNFAPYFAVPVFGFEWKPAEDWTVTLKGYRLSAMKSVTERFSVGPFIGGRGGMWAVETRRGARLMDVRSLVAGICAEYDFSSAGQRKRILTASIGSTLTSTVRFYEYGGDRNADESHHYRPGFYASFGVDFRF